MLPVQEQVRMLPVQERRTEEMRTSLLRTEKSRSPKLLSSSRLTPKQHETVVWPPQRARKQLTESESRGPQPIITGSER